MSNSMDDDELEGLSDEELEDEYQSQLFRMFYHLASKGDQVNVLVKNVYIDGLKKTDESLITRHLEPILQAKTLEDLLSASTDAQNELNALGIFKEVEIKLDSHKGRAGQVDLLVEVKEKGLLDLTVQTSAGANSYEGGLSAQIANVTGKADIIDFRYSRSTSSASVFEIAYKYPVGGCVDFPFRIGINQAEMDCVMSSHKQITKGMFASYKTHSDLGSHELRYNLDWRTVSSLAPQASFAVREEAGHSVKSSISHTLLMHFTPIESALQAAMKISNEISGLGMGVTFLKNTMEFATSIPISAFQLAYSIQAGHLMPLDSRWFSRCCHYIAAKPLPKLSTDEESRLSKFAAPSIVDKFFLGGGCNLRGFKWNGVGPRSRLDALGGSAFVSSSLQLFTPIPYKPWREKIGSRIQPHLFINGGACVDLSQLGSTAYDKLGSLPGHVAVSAGAGLCMKGKGFQIELNYCIPLVIGSSALQSPGFQFGVGINLF
eukprot:m.342123 g.342123  ORF g.342123 m.342123 type:complete len:490 (+) comp20967_c0_seq1:19-1488(+)